MIERTIPHPARRWAAARIARTEPPRSADVLARIQFLGARDGDAVMVGLLDVADVFPVEACDALIGLGCGWPSGTVRLPALRLLAVRDFDRARSLAREDPSTSIREKADRLAPAPRFGVSDQHQESGTTMTQPQCGDATAGQLSMFA